MIIFMAIMLITFVVVVLFSACVVAKQSDDQSDFMYQNWLASTNRSDTNRSSTL